MIGNDGMLLITFYGTFIIWILRLESYACVYTQTHTHIPTTTHTFTTIHLGVDKNGLHSKNSSLVYYNHYISLLLSYGGKLFYLSFIGYLRD